MTERSCHFYLIFDLTGPSENLAAIAKPVAPGKKISLGRSMVEENDVLPATVVMVQSMSLAAIPSITMLLGGIYPLISTLPPNQKFSIAKQHFAGVDFEFACNIGRE